MKQIHQTPCTLQKGGKFAPSGGIEDVIPAKKRSPSGQWTPVKDLSEEYFVRASERRQYGVKRAGRRATRNVAPIGHSGDYLTRSAGRAEGTRTNSDGTVDYMQNLQRPESVAMHSNRTAFRIGKEDASLH